MNENINVAIIINENEALKREVNELKEHLKKYTNSTGHKQYYERNKEIVKEKAQEHTKKIKETNPEKIKQYNRTAYLNRKAKMLQVNENNNSE